MRDVYTLTIIVQLAINRKKVELLLIINYSLDYEVNVNVTMYNS